MEGILLASRATSRTCFAGRLTCWWRWAAWRGGGDAGVVVVVGGSVVVDGNAGAGNRTEQGVGAAAGQQPWRRRPAGMSAG